MQQYSVDPHQTETAGHSIGERAHELHAQHWDRSQSHARASAEGIEFNDEHWAVISLMRDYYRDQGLPINARTTARMLNRHFAAQGGGRYLRALFSGGPVTQGSRIANLRTPAYATDPAFGSSY